MTPKQPKIVEKRVVIGRANPKPNTGCAVAASTGHVDAWRPAWPMDLAAGGGHHQSFKRVLATSVERLV